MSAHLSAGEIYFILLTFIIHLFSPPFLLNCFNFILLYFNPVVLLFRYLYFNIIMIHQQIIYITTTQWQIYTFTLLIKVNTNQCTIQFENALNFRQRSIFVCDVIRYFFYYMNKIREFNFSVFIA